MALVDLDNLSETDKKLILSKAMSDLGRKGGKAGGKSRSAAKQTASRSNGKLGGRPRKVQVNNPNKRKALEQV